MNPFWNSLFEHLSGCGRNATLFLVALGGFFGLLIGSSILVNAVPPKYLPVALTAAGMALAAWAARAFKLVRARRQRTGREILSDDELAKARSKLHSIRRPKQLPKRASEWERRAPPRPVSMREHPTSRDGARRSC